MDILRDYYSATTRRVRFHHRFLAFLSVVIIVAGMDNQAFNGAKSVGLVENIVGKAVSQESFARWFPIPLFLYGAWTWTLLRRRWELRRGWIVEMKKENASEQMDWVLRDETSRIMAPKRFPTGLYLHLLGLLFIMQLPILAYSDAYDKILRGRLDGDALQVLQGTKPGTPLFHSVFALGYLVISVYHFFVESMHLRDLRTLRETTRFEMTWPRWTILFWTAPLALAFQIVLSGFLVATWTNEHPLSSCPTHPPHALAHLLAILLLVGPLLIVCILPILAWTRLQKPSDMACTLMRRANRAASTSVLVIIVTALLLNAPKYATEDSVGWRGVLTLVLSVVALIASTGAYVVVAGTAGRTQGAPDATSGSSGNVKCQ